MLHVRSRTLTVLVALLLVPLALAQEVAFDADTRGSRPAPQEPAQAAAPAAGPSADPARPPPPASREGAPTGRYIVGFHEGAGAREMAAKADQYGATLARGDERLGFGVYAPRDAREFERRVREDPRVRYVEAEGTMRALLVPNDPGFPSMYGPQNVGAPLAWNTSTGSVNAAVCVVDTGVRYTHEDINGTRWKGGHDFVNGDADPMDDQGHGTHVAGTAAAGLNNAKGISGMGNVALYGVKVLDAGGYGSWSDIASGIRWCADHTMNRTVVSLSLGGSEPSMAVHDAVKHAVASGRLVVAAAGNSGPCAGCVGYPAAYPEALAVGCTTSARSLCSFSSSGPEVDLSAPGHNILSAWHTGNAAYQTISGTSMSTPHVSGAAALIWSRYTNLTAADLRVKLEETARDLGPAGRDDGFGVGELNASAAIVPRLPSQPQSYNVSHWGGRVEITWTLPKIQGGDIRAYQVHRTLNGTTSLLATVGGAASGHADPTCPNVSLCSYSVRAVNVYGPGAFTATRSASPNRAPLAGTLACAPNPLLAGEATTCALDVHDDSLGVATTVAWGDGASTRVPASGFAAPGRVVLSHVYASAGNRTVSFSVADTGGLATTRTAGVAVQPLDDCGTGGDAGNTFATASWLPMPSTGCTGILRASDAYDFYAVHLGAGQTLDVSMTPNGASDYDLCLLDPSGAPQPCPFVGGNGTETRTATATSGNAGTWRIRVWNYSGGGAYSLSAAVASSGDNAAPVMRSITCLDNPAQAGDHTTCLFRASDDSAGVYYAVSWGDGSTTRVPASGYARPGSTQSATHLWATAGTFVVSVTAHDSSSLASASVSTYQFVE